MHFMNPVHMHRSRPTQPKPGTHAVSRRAFVQGGATLAALAGIALASFGRALPAYAAGASSSEGDASTASTTSTAVLAVYASFYPVYDFVQKIGGDRVEVRCLVPAGTEPHDWEPATTDIRALADADVLVYHGAGMEHWADDVLASLGNDQLVATEASRGIELRELGEGEGDAHGHAEGEADAHGHAGEGAGGDGDADAAGVDPHVWLAPLKAKEELANIRDGLKRADPDGASAYDANYETWAAALDGLDEEYRERLAGVSSRTIVVSHEAYGYLCDAYDLVQEAIAGIEADGEPDARRMAEIADFARKHDVRVIFSEELVSPKVAQAIATEAGARVEQLNPLEGLTDEQLAAGEDYLSVMRDNLAKLVDALS